MNIIGTGIDIVDVKRIATILKKKNNFKKRIFSIHEIKQSKNKKKNYHFFAKRFAAKEAFSKALGVGISEGLNFNEIEVFNSSKGKPSIKIRGKSINVVKKVTKKKRIKIFLSLTDESKYAIAMVIIAML
ncbi:MAG: holo-ACP synthase [Candidatus Pelagibacter sp. TMED165]|mgnify:FL=1|nr:MAG: holo-ACP synthase [Candidatus Pelagibacter sp. TMED165]